MYPHHNATRPERKRLAIVARVSTEDQEEYGTSLDDQVAKGRLLAQLHDYTLDDRPHDQGGHTYSGDESGALELAHRPIMRRLLADARAKKFDAVCFTKIDRIARRPGRPSLCTTIKRLAVTDQNRRSHSLHRRACSARRHAYIYRTRGTAYTPAAPLRSAAWSGYAGRCAAMPSG